MQIGLDRVLFVPNFVSPFKVGRAVTPGPLRREMLARAIADNEAFVLDDRELARPGPSYTVDTLGELKAENPDAELLFLTGTDAVRDLPKWSRPERVLELAQFVAVTRPGVNRAEVLGALPDEWEARISFLEVPQLDISSSYLRARILEGGSIRYLVPRAVEQFIAAHGLYRTEGPEVKALSGVMETK